MKPTSPTITNPTPDSQPPLGTLPANPSADIQSPSEGAVSKLDSVTSHDEVRQTDSLSATSAVHKSPDSLAGQPQRFVTVKELARIYGIKIGAIYAFIEAEPDFPYVNVGVKKKFLVDIARFEVWIAERTEKQKHERFAIPSAFDLMTAFKTKAPGGPK